MWKILWFFFVNSLPKKSYVQINSNILHSSCQNQSTLCNSVNSCLNGNNTKGQVLRKCFRIRMIELIRMLNILDPNLKYQGQFITARIRSMTEGNVFTLSTISGGEGGYPVPGLWVGGVPHPRSEGYPSQVQMVWGYPSPGLGVYSGQVWMMGGTLSMVWGVPWPGLDGGRATPGKPPQASSWWWGYPPGQVWMVEGVPQVNPPRPGMDGVPPHPLHRAAEWALATWWAVCLLHSCRRTFLFYIQMAAPGT